MYKYVIKRLVALIPVILGVIFIIQLILYLSPSDAAVVILGNNYTVEGAEAVRESLGLNRPFLVQFFSYVGGLLRLDFGNSYISGEPVIQQLAARFPNTLILVMVSMLLCTVLSIPIGIRSAVKPNSLFSNITAAFGMIGIALPTFWLGLMLMLLFAVRLDWLPATGSVSLEGLILPSITLAASFMAGTMRTTRSAMLDCLNQDYIRTAKAKGVSSHDVVNKHALKNALLPVITVVGMNIGTQMGGSVLTETVFSYPGLGVMLMNGINQKDTPTILGCLVVMALCIGLCNLLVDIIFALVDPRIKSQYSKGR